MGCARQEAVSPNPHSDARYWDGRQRLWPDRTYVDISCWTISLHLFSHRLSFLLIVPYNVRITLTGHTRRSSTCHAIISSCFSRPLRTNGTVRPVPLILRGRDESDDRRFHLG